MAAPWPGLPPRLDGRLLISDRFRRISRWITATLRFCRDRNRLRIVSATIASTRSCCCSGFVLARAARLTSCRLARTGAGGGVGWTIHLPAGNTQFGSCLVDRCHPTATPALASIVRTLGQAPDDLSLPQHPIPPRGRQRQVPIRSEGNRLFVAHSSPPGCAPVSWSSAPYCR